MTTLYLGNRVQPMRSRLEAIGGPLRFLYLGNREKSTECLSYLRTRPMAEELVTSDLVRKSSKSFRTKYIDFIGQLNRNNGSLSWWAMTFTDKNPSSQELAEKALYFLLVVELVSAEDAPLVVVTDHGDLVAQLRAWCKQRGIQAECSFRSDRPARSLLKTWTPIAVIWASIKTLVYWLLARKLRLTANPEGIDLAFITPTHPWCYNSKGDFKDAYFSPLIERLTGSGKRALLTPLVQEQPMTQFVKLRKASAPLPLAPFESFLSLWSITVCTFVSLKAFFHPIQIHGPVELNGLDLNCLVKRRIRQECQSGSFYMTLRAFYCGQQFGFTVRPSRCIYPFGNLAWEKLFMLGVRKTSKSTSMIGYAHASVTPRHMNLMFSKNEASVTPLPDKVITTGEVVEGLLRTEGNYPEGIFETACALRQGNDIIAEPKDPAQVFQTILVTMATSTHEYIQTLHFLEQAFAESDEYVVIVRPHPVIPIADAIANAELSGTDFYSVDTGTLGEALDKSDVVLYASSTVGMEAVSRGIPAVYLDFGNVFNSDPMSNWDSLKWTVSDPKQLIPTIKSINALPEQEFKQRQRKGQEYVSSYLRPVTEENLRPFWGD